MLLRMLPVSAGGLSSAAGEAAARAVHPARWRLAAGPRRQLGHQGPGGAAEIRAPAMDQHDRNRDLGSGDAHGPQASRAQLFATLLYALDTWTARRYGAGQEVRHARQLGPRR